jgi:hypothetical protein
MKRTALWIALATALVVLPAAVATAEGEGGGADTRILTGEYYWSGSGSSGDLEAIFTPTGEETWTVDFNFTFRGNDHTYSGTAAGKLSGGKLKGEVTNETGKRTFTFAGKFEDGKFRGDHTETTGGNARSTGTLTLGE